MLKVDIKSKIYKMKNENFKALDNVNFEINEKGIVCILGPSGSGKTTLMNIVGALDSDFEGDVVINGKSLKNFKDRDLDSYRKNTIGFIFQQFYLINKFSAYDNVKVALSLSNSKEKKEKIMDTLKKVELDKFAKRKVNVLSGGQKQRVAIARALINDPDIILADEPTGALDTKMSLEVMELLRELSKTKLVIIITHSDELANEYADSIIKMEDGKVISIEENKKEEEKIETRNEENTSKEFTKSSMSFFKAFKYSLKNIFGRKARTIATAIGMSIGIIGVGMALALSNGTMKIAKAQIDSMMPTNMLMVSQKTSDDDKSSSEIFSSMQEMKTFSYSDIENIKSSNGNITHYWAVPTDVMRTFFSEFSLSESRAKTTEVESASFTTMNGFEPYENVEGDLTLGKKPENEKEIVVSLNTAEYLIGDNSSMKIEDLIGKNIYAKFGPNSSYGQESDENKILDFKIVGITSVNTMGYSMYQYSMDTLKLYEELFEKKKEDMKFYQVYMYVDKNLSIDEIKNTINEINATQTKYKVEGAATTMFNSVDTVLKVIRNVLIGFSSISIVVAVLMIGIVVFISVIERISEIGILRAIGARSKDIRNIFLSESIIIGLLSGIIGIFITNLFCEVVNKMVSNIITSYGMNIGNVNIAVLSVSATGVLVLACVILSAIAGIIPSVKAAKMDPIVALRRN